MGPGQKRKSRAGALAKRRPQCLFCGKVLQNYFSLEMHMNSHTRERPWECTHCDATFMSYNVLMVHRNNIHYGRKYKCSLCHKLFTISAHLYTHRKKAHPHAEKGSIRAKIQGERHSNHNRRVLGSGRKVKSKVRKDPPSEETPELVATTATNTSTSSSFTTEEEEDERRVVEIESNPGTPLMTVNVLSKDADVVSKLKLPVIKIQRLPDGVWKQKIVNSSQSETENDTVMLFGAGDMINEDDQETEPDDDGDDFSSEDQVYAELKVYPPLPLYQYQATEPEPSPSSLLPHQIPPLPPFNMVFPPFPFKLHNYTVSPDNSLGDYFGGAGATLNSYNNQQSQLQNMHPQNCWDTSFFLHLNRYKPEDTCYHSNNNNNNHSDPPITKSQPDKSCQTDAKSSIRSSRSYQYVSKYSLKKKFGMKNLKGSRSVKKSSGKAKKKKKTPPKKANSIANCGKKVLAMKAEKEELIEESETGVFTCKECGKEFQIKWNLLTHLMTHTGEKPFGCYFCKMRFRQKAHMIKHIASIHRFQDDEKKPSTGTGGKGKGKVCEKDEFSCGFCGQTYQIKLGLIKHISQLHSEKLMESV